MNVAGSIRVHLINRTLPPAACFLFSALAFGRYSSGEFTAGKHASTSTIKAVFFVASSPREWWRTWTLFSPEMFATPFCGIRREKRRIEINCGKSALCEKRYFRDRNELRCVRSFNLDNSRKIVHRRRPLRNLALLQRNYVCIYLSHCPSVAINWERSWNK